MKYEIWLFVFLVRSRGRGWVVTFVTCVMTGFRVDPPSLHGLEVDDPGTGVSWVVGDIWVCEPDADPYKVWSLAGAAPRPGKSVAHFRPVVNFE